MQLLSKILRIGEGKELKRYKQLAEYIISLEEELGKLSDTELKAKTEDFKKRLQAGETIDDFIAEAFAVAREASWRVLHQKHYLVQIMGGLALHYGNVAEMKTGEGKTLTAVLPAYLNALTGKGVHIVTVNDYLAKRDAEQMGRVHRFLGLTVGVIMSDDEPNVRVEAYNCDITYGTNNQFGFDYLRDNMATDVSELVQRGQFYAIVDEVDSILIDEARTPLIISGPAGSSSKWYTEFARIADKMKKDEHYEVDIKKRTIGVHEAGVAFVEDQLGIDNLYESVNSSLVGYLNNAIRAKELFERDKDYIVDDKEVMIVDEFTGRILAGRRFSDGLHQALEAKESVEIQEENQTFASITLQNYFRLYKKLSGMTGTASTEAAELKEIYGLGVVSIPTNKPLQRTDKEDLVYVSEEAKFAAVVEDIADRYQKGQPVLVGTTSVERSEYLSKQLKKRGIKHNVLNAKNHSKEGNIVAEAGMVKAVTVATNMAGRGTDIVLGGTTDVILDNRLKNEGLDPINDPVEYQKRWDELVDGIKAEQKEIATQVKELGGLYVIGTERHESRRIDDQLRGRSGRQGDPGESRFYLSLQDELARKFIGGSFVEGLLTKNLPEGDPIESKLVSKQIKSAQAQIENINFEIRKNVLKYDEVLDQQRVLVYSERNKILHGEDVQDQIKSMMEDVIKAYIDGATAEGYVEDWDFAELWTAFKRLYPIGISYKDLVYDEAGEVKDITPEELYEAILSDANKAYAEAEEINNSNVPGGMRTLERNVLLRVLDNAWRDHLYEMDALKDGIGLRSAAQRDPVVEYQREGHDMFMAMLDSVKEETVRLVFNSRIVENNFDGEMPLDNNANKTEEEQVMEQALATIQGMLDGLSLDDAQNVVFSGPDEDGGVEIKREVGPKHSPKSQTNSEKKKKTKSRSKTNRKSRK